MPSLAHLIIKTKGIAMRPYPYRYGLLLLLFLLYSGTLFPKNTSIPLFITGL